MSIKKSLESSFSLTFASYTALAISFVYSIILVRIISVEGMGMIGMGLTFLEIIALLATLGSITIIQTYTTHYIAKGEYGFLKFILKKSTGIIMSIAGAASVITFLFSKEISILIYNTEIMDFPLKVVAGFIVANIALKILDTVLRATKQFLLFGKIQVLSAALNLLLTLLFIYYASVNISTDDDMMVASSFLASCVVATICIAIILFSNRRGIRRMLGIDATRPPLEKILKFGASTASLELISMWGVYINALAIGFFLEPEEWGYYYIAVLVVTGLTVFKTVLNIIAYPSLVDAHARKDSGEFNLTIHIMFKYWTLFFVPLTMAFVLFLPFAIPIIWGAAYEKSVLIAQILLVGFVIQYYSSIYLSTLTAMEKPEKQLTPVVLNVVLNVGLGIWLVYTLGILGAAVTVLITNVVTFFVSRHIFIRERAGADANARRRFSTELWSILAVELTVLGALFVPCWIILGMISAPLVKFAVAAVFGALLALMSISYVFGRKKLSDDETARIFEMFPQSVRPLLRRMRSGSAKIWRG
jgi:stage V sporulation protein B